MADLLQEELSVIVPAVEEANGISAEMNKHVQFEIVLVAPKDFIDPGGKTVPNQVSFLGKTVDA